jgi:hypothetical protein
VGKVTRVVVALFAAVFCLSGEATADGMMVKHHPRKVSGCAYGCDVRRPVCPTPYACNTLYGGYGPYGGRAYWSMYTYSGWN